ncbi:facilitated trehalose transporter Tret1-like isoform X2 [Coccinella septempunctata]|nr:facilitated trehalose transporter Tret1-like isoform X2 [Coccinella septempunctata]
MQYGWTAPSIPILESADSPVPITSKDGVWLESLYMLGGIAGLPFSIYLVDAIGRKKTVLISSVVGLCGWILIGAGTSVNHLFMGRFLLGMTADIAFNASPMYISEIAHQKIRGFLAGIIYLMMLFGIVVMYSIGPLVSIQTAAIVGGSILLSQFIIFPFMPESPYYLLYVNKEDSAKRALERLRVDDDVTKELMEIKKAVERQKTEKGRPLDLFLIKSNRRACVIVMLLNNTQHFVGITVLIMNLHEILNHAGSDLISSSAAGIIFSSLMLIAASAATFTVDRIGRKILLLVSGLLTSISLFTIAVYFHMQSMFLDLKSFSWIPMISVMFYALTFKLGLGIVPIVTTAELFPARVKGWGLAVSDLVYVVSSSLSIYVYQWLNDGFGIHVSFYLFGIYCLISTVLISIYVPETKGKTLEEIQMILKR